MLYESVNLNPPANTEFEISLFGTGYGEAVLCHLGDNEWGVIDSNLNPETNRSLVLEYLDRIAPAANISVIVATHFHDDHIKGLSQIVEKHPGACFVFSNALIGNEFLQLVLGENDLVDSSSGCREFYRILNLLETAPKSASEAKRIFKNKYCEIFSLSPSDYAEAVAREEIKEYLPQEGLKRKRIVPKRTNYFSVVLKCIFKNQTIWLLGSDLENHADDRWGWRAILSSNLISKDKAHVFKIPHHGSEGAHNDNVWLDFLVKNPISLLTPFVNGRTVLPTLKSLKRISAYSRKSFITAKPERKRAKNSDSTVRRILKETRNEVFIMNSQVGHIQVRMDVGKLNSMDSWEIKTFGAALDVAKII